MGEKELISFLTKVLQICVTRPARPSGRDNGARIQFKQVHFLELSLCASSLRRVTTDLLEEVKIFVAQGGPSGTGHSGQKSGLKGQ